MHLIALHDSVGLINSYLILSSHDFYLFFIYLIPSFLFIIWLSIFFLFFMFIENSGNLYCVPNYNILNIRNRKFINFLTARKYSSISTPSNNKTSSYFIRRSWHPYSLNNLYDWFSGISDGECCFYIKKGKTPNQFEFIFKIALHKDDSEVLRFLKKSLAIGKVYTSGNMVSYCVNVQRELLIIFDILDKYTLNSTKIYGLFGFKKSLWTLCNI